MTTEVLVQKLLHYDKNKPNSLRAIKDELEWGADPNIIFSEDGVCAMLLAAGLGSDVLCLLLQHHGDPNVQSLDGTTPLHIAASWGDFDTLELLLCSGASADLHDQDGKTALDLALENENDVCSEELKRHAMLAAYEDHSLSPKFTFHDDVGSRTRYFPPPSSNVIDGDDDTHEARKTKKWDLDKSFIEPELLSSAYSNTVTQKVYDCLEQGKRVCLDATSPTTPFVIVKPPTSSVHHSHYFPRIPSPCCSESSSACLPRRLNVEFDDCHPPSHHSCYHPQSHHRSVHETCCHARNCLSSHTHSQSPQSCSRLSPMNHCCHVSSPTTENVHASHSCSSSFTKLKNFDLKSSRHDPMLNSREMKNKSHSQSVLRGRFESEDHHSRDISLAMEKTHTKKSLAIRTNASDDYLASVNGISRRISEVKMNEDRLPVAGLGSEIKSTRTANFVLSCPDILSQIDIEQRSPSPNDSISESRANSSQRNRKSSCPEFINDEKNSATFDSGFYHDTGRTKSSMKAPVEKQNQHSLFEPTIAPNTQEKTILNSSVSSCDSFSTCQSAFDENNLQVEFTHESVDMCLSDSKDKIKLFHENEPNRSNRWQAPLINVVDEDLMTSDDSFIQNEAQRRKCIGAMRKTNHSFPPVRQELSHILQHGIPKQSGQVFKDNGIVTREKARLSDDSMFSTVSVKEYVYTDKERGITLIERHIPSDCGSSVGRRSLDSVSSVVSRDSKVSLNSQCTLIYDWCTVKPPASPFTQKTNALNDTLTISSENQSQTLTLDEVEAEEQVIVPARIESLSNDEVTKELQRFGELPGPVIAATRQIYLRRLASLESNPSLVQLSKICPDFPCELRKALDGLCDWNTDLADLEAEMADSFTASHGRQWREGTAKSSFTYLLLDPRVTNNLPFRARELSEAEAFKTFICSIFYIGKGKRARPYCHLYEAVAKLKETEAKRSTKVKHIIDIWEDGHGVVSLHCFQSVIPVEAFTREACMLEAIGLHKVTNVKRGDFYGIACSWSMQRRRQLGVYLLKKAFTIFIAEGERQIYIPDLK